MQKENNNFSILALLIILSTFVLASDSYIGMNWNLNGEYGYHDGISIAIDYELSQTGQPDPNTGFSQIKILKREEVIANGIRNQDLGSLPIWTAKLEPNFVEDPNSFSILFHRFEILY